MPVWRRRALLSNCDWRAAELIAMVGEPQLIPRQHYHGRVATTRKKIPVE
jgi:hypothetical protein